MGDQARHDTGMDMIGGDGTERRHLLERLRGKACHAVAAFGPLEPILATEEPDLHRASSGICRKAHLVHLRSERRAHLRAEGREPLLAVHAERGIVDVDIARLAHVALHVGLEGRVKVAAEAVDCARRADIVEPTQPFATVELLVNSDRLDEVHWAIKGALQHNSSVVGAEALGDERAATVGARLVEVAVALDDTLPRVRERRVEVVENGLG